MSAPADTEMKIRGDTADIGLLMNFDRYPIANLDSPAARNIIAAGRDALAERGAARFDGFVTAAGIAQMAAEAVRLEPLAHQQNDQFTAYIGDPQPSDLPENHPRRLMQRTSQAAVAWDLIPATAAIRRFYMWDGLTDFVAALLGKERFFRSADPLAACNLAYIKNGDELGWHFDSSEFSVTLQIQAPVGGGRFDFVPHIRSADEQNYAAVQRILQGGTVGMLSADCVPGALSVFRGHHSMHRVTPVTGHRARVTAILTYAEVPDFTVSDYSRRTFYGRLA